ncbi:MAG: hypothetical protein ACYCW6_18885 [Candidatus Xenobia bacterium]
MSLRILVWTAPFLGWFLGLLGGLMIAAHQTYSSPLIWTSGGALLGFIAGYAAWFYWHASLVSLFDIVAVCRKDMRELMRR